MWQEDSKEKLHVVARERGGFWQLDRGCVWRRFEGQIFWRLPGARDEDPEIF